MPRMPAGIGSILIFAIATVSMNTGEEGQNLVSNGLFNTNIDGWTLTGGGPESVITWDGAKEFSPPDVRRPIDSHAIRGIDGPILPACPIGPTDPGRRAPFFLSAAVSSPFPKKTGSNRRNRTVFG